MRADQPSCCISGRRQVCIVNIIYIYIDLSKGDDILIKVHVCISFNILGCNVMVHVLLYNRITMFTKCMLPHITLQSHFKSVLSTSIKNSPSVNVDKCSLSAA